MLHLNLQIIDSFHSNSSQNLGTNATRCYTCLFHLAHCTNPLDCYNQPDTCSNTNFSPVLSQVVDCEFGCEQYVITDATGALVVWRRGCATQGSPKSSYICFSRNIYFLRHEQCWCHADYCNSSIKVKINFQLLSILMLVMSTYLVRYEFLVINNQIS